MMAMLPTAEATRATAPDAGYRNMPQLVQEYSAHFLAGK